MTGNQLLVLGLGLLGEPLESADDYKDYSLSAVNIILAECFPVNNSILESKGKTKLDILVQLISLDDIIPYEDSLVISCLSYGVAAKLALEDDSSINKFNYFTQMYIEAMSNNAQWISHRIEDVYL